MKKTIALLVCLVSMFTATSFAQDTLRWDKANASYAEGNFKASINDYEQLIEEGENSWKIYYNLGAAYFKDGQIGRAIINTERAARLSPSNDDIEHNLKVLSTQTIDKIDKLPEFFLVDWLQSARDTFSPNSWVVLMLFFVAATIGAVVVWRLKRNSTFKAVAIVTLILALCSYGFAHSAYNRIEGGNDAIVLNTASVVRSSPDSNGKELFVLHEGTKVEVGDTFGLYTEIVIASGNKGWILSKDIESI